MSKEMKLTIPSVYVSDIEKLIHKIRNNSESEDAEISFEFIIASLFPTCWKNIQTEMGRQYALGYVNGQNDYKQEHFLKMASDADCYCE